MPKKQNDMSSKSKKLIKQLIRESKPEPFVIDGRVVYFNPLKKLLEGEAYKTLDGVAVTQEMVKKYVDAVANGTQYSDANGIKHDVDKSKKVLASYNKFIDDLNSQSVARNVDGDLMTTAEIEALTAGLAKGWDLVDGVSKQLGNINFELDQGLMGNERSKRVIEQQIQEIDGQLDQIAKLKQQEKNSDSYKHKSEATSYNDKYHK